MFSTHKFSLSILSFKLKLHIYLPKKCQLPTFLRNHTSKFFPNNYHVFRKDRESGGGGVFILLREDIEYNENAFENGETDSETTADAIATAKLVRLGQSGRLQRVSTPDVDTPATPSSSETNTASHI